MKQINKIKFKKIFNLIKQNNPVRILNRHQQLKQAREASPAVFFIYGTAARPELTGGKLQRALAHYTERLFSLASFNRVTILSHNPGQGIWEGEKEPSFRTVILAKRADAFKVCQRIRAEFNQASILLIEPSPSGKDKLFSFKRNEASEEEAAAAINSKGYTILSNEIEIAGREEEAAAAAAAADKLESGEVKAVSVINHWINKPSAKQLKKQARREAVLTKQTNKTKEEREREEEAVRAEEIEREEEAKREEAAREARRQKAKARREREAREAREAAGYSEEAEAEAKEAFRQLLNEALNGNDQAEENLEGLKIKVIKL
jgi:hypothetical protein